jgi:hypothetical protein
VCNNVLPVTQNLFARKITLSSDCPIYFQEPETMVHSLWSCPSAMVVWQEGSRRIQKLALGANDGMELVRQLFAKLSIEEVGEALVTARLIWLRRNKAVFEHSFSPPTSVIERAKQDIADFLEVFYSRKSTSRGDPNSPYQIGSATFRCLED